jgi:cyclopropane fatty-acyl-phospholipid synthase-like methyltransferase
MEPDLRQFSPSTSRNRDPILAVLREVVTPGSKILEIASGTGEHAVHFAAGLDGVVIQPTDPSAEARTSIEAWRRHVGEARLLPPLDLDVRRAPWPVERADAIVCINMIHIAPWAACEALMAGAARSLPSGGPLILYGPYKRDGRHTAASNEAFDASLRRRDPGWGVRDLADVTALAAREGLALERIVEMPANNLTVVFRRVPF